MFSALILGHPRKVQQKRQDGIHEYMLKEKLQDGFYTFEEQGLIARSLWLATPEEKEQAMQNTPIVNALTSMWNKDSNIWFCHPLNINQVEKHKGLHFPVPLFLPSEELSILQPIQAWIIYGYSRHVLIFKDLAFRYPTERLDFARRTIAAFEQLPKGLTLEERAAAEFAAKSMKPPTEILIQESLQFVGAIFLSYQDLGNGQYKVQYEYKNEQDEVTVNQRMTVIDAGICLIDRHGEHYKGHVDYDLASIVLVKYKGRHRYEEDDED